MATTMPVMLWSVTAKLKSMKEPWIPQCMIKPVAIRMMIPAPLTQCHILSHNG